MNTPGDAIHLDTCGCCKAGLPLSQPHDNRPGLDVLRYRIGTHGRFLQRMLARLSTALPALTSRADDDPAIALLDAWATVADVLTFYTERTANEHYLRTATERLSILELARAIGYELNPGVAAGTVLAFTLEDFPGSPEKVTIPVGTRVQSSPAPGDEALTFETVEEIEARPAWNALRPRQTRPQRLAIHDNGEHLYRFTVPGDPPLSGSRVTTLPVDQLFPTSEVALGAGVTELQVQGVNELVLAGVTSKIAAGDRLLFVGVRGDATRTLVAPVLAVDANAEEDYTRVSLDIPLPPPPLFIKPLVLQLAAQLMPLTPTPLPLNTLHATQLLANNTLTESEVLALTTTNQWAHSDFAITTKPPPPPPPRAHSDFAITTSPPPPPPAIFAFGARVAFFGHNGPYYRSLPESLREPPGSGGFTSPPGGILPQAVYPINWDADNSLSIWKDSLSRSTPYYDEGDTSLPDVYLERVVSEITPESWVAFERPTNTYRVYRIQSAVERSLVGFGIGGRTTGLVLTKEDGKPLDNEVPEDKPEALHFRTSTAYVLSERLELAALPIEDEVPQGATEIVLDGAVFELQAGRQVVLRGEQANNPGVYQSELLTLDESLHVYMQEPAGTVGHTTLRFKPGLQYPYERSRVTINANIARATHGETVQQVLGSGDGAQANQRFQLRKPPLTYVPAQTPSGARSTLEIRVNGVLQEEVFSLYGLGPRDERYIVRHSDDGIEQIVFGDGEHGARLPSGFENVTATYRSGTGLAGNLPANNLTLLLSRPAGVGQVTNPLPASGGASPEHIAEARNNAPLTVLTFDRIVSLQDFEDFAHAFAGIGKAQVLPLWNGEQQVVHITIAAANGDTVDPQSDLYNNLLRAIEAARDPLQRVCIGGYIKRLFSVTAKILVDPHFNKDEVFDSVNTTLREVFAFERRAFGQPVTAAEVMGVMQNMPGVIAVDLDKLYRNLIDLSGRTTLLPAAPARWSKGKGGPTAGCEAILPAELLLINKAGINLREMPR